MKKLFISIIIFIAHFFLFGQIPAELNYSCGICESSQCTAPNEGGDCGHTSPLWSSNDLYIPSDDFEDIYVKVNLIFLHKNDGTGMFIEGDPEHDLLIADLVSQVNLTYSSLINSSDPDCYIPNGFLSTAKIQIVPNIVHINDEYGWNNENDVYPYCPSPPWYLDYLDDQIANDPDIPSGINVYFTETAWYYEDLIVNQTTEDPGPIGNACSQYPSTSNLDRTSRIHMPNTFTKYWWMKHIAPGIYNQPWDPVIRGWFVSSTGKLLAHELGHSFWLPHIYYCNWNLMKPDPIDWKSLFPDQIGKMHRCLSITNVRKFTTDESYISTPFLIDENTLWDLNFTMYQDVIIEFGYTLTVTCKLIMKKNTKIIVKPGGKFIVDGGIITTEDSSPWQGIEIWGNSNAHQYPDANGNYQQGYVELKNGAVIENAYEAVRMWKPDDWQSMGGILIASDATFRNNRRAVEFMSYQNFYPAPGAPRPNKSQFVDCVFETDENYIYTGDFHTFVSMWQVDGVKFYGCDFEDKRVAFQYPPYYQAVGIWTIDANFHVLPDCGISNYDCWSCPDHNIDRSSFSGLNVAIYSSQERTTKTFVIDRTDFVNNLHGIYNAANDYASCIRSDFEAGTKQLTGPYYIPLGIFNHSSTGFTFNQNDFTVQSSLPPGLDFTAGIWCNFIGEDVNTVYNNDFIGLGYGNIASGDNHNSNYPHLGLIYKCNYNSANLKYDFYIYGGEGIATYQGTEDEAAGNTFCHNTTPDGSDFANLATWPVNYYYYEGNSDEDPINTIGVWKEVAPENLCENRYITNSNIRLSEAEKDDYRQQYYDNKTEYDNIKALYESLKDGGSTPDTKLDIETSWPDETWELRAQLLADSPHLSEEVLMAAADKTDVLPHTIMFEICMANPEEMRNEQFLEYLATKDDPMPQYMIDDLRDGADEDTYKSVLQNEMAGYAYLWGTACKNLIRDIVLDSIGINYDSLRLWLCNKESLISEYEIVDSYLAEDDLTNSLAHLNNIPINYDLSDKQLEEYNYFHDLKTTIIYAQQQGRNIFQLDSLEILDLVYIADTSKYLAGVQAQSILNFAYGYSYLEFPDLPEPNMKSGQIQNKGLHDKVMQEGNHFISAHPNPASQWVAFNYTLPYPSEKAIISIYDASGKIVNIIELQAAIGQTIWDTRKIPSGLYFYSLRVNGVVIDKRKLIINK